MKKNELEQRVGELSDLKSTLEKTLSMALDELKRLESGGEEVMKYLNDISGFARESIEKSQGLSAEERLKFLEANVSKLVGWSQAEMDRIKHKPGLLTERVATLQSVIAHLDERSKSHEARIAAIERAADPNRDKRHPEKLSVRRAVKEQEEED